MSKKTERELRFEQIDKDITELDDDSLDFATWLLLDRLIQRYKTEMEKVDDKEFKDALYKNHLRDSIKVLDDVRQCLTYKLW